MEPLADDPFERELHRLTPAHLQTLSFAPALEAQFEADTASERSHRFWLEGLIAIVALNLCLLLDLLLLRQGRWRDVILHTAVVTPLALLVNTIMRLRPAPWLREGSVALGTALIGLISMRAEGNATAAATSFGLMCVLLMVLFANVVMRLRFAYAAAVTVILFAGGLIFGGRATGLQPSEKVVGCSLLAVGVAITLTAGYSLERQERIAYLLVRRGALQAEELARLNQMLQRLSLLDKLTGLPNRRAFDDKFEALWNTSERTHTPLSAILVDVDHFKVVNDVLGHLYGDQVLERIAGLLPQAIRGHGDFVSRFGGEEFVVLLPDAGTEVSLVVAERIRALVEAAATPPSEMRDSQPMIWTTVSCGAATCLPNASLRRTDLLHAADQALYRAKSAGRNQISAQPLEAANDVDAPVTFASLSESAPS